MILKDEEVGAMAFQCDHCTNLSDDYSLDNFQAAADDIREQGWKIKRDHKAEGGWSHVCPSHTGQNRVEEQRKLLGL